MSNLSILICSWYAFQGFKPLRALPIGHEFVLVAQAPFLNDASRLIGESPRRNLACPNIDKRLKPLVSRVDMWRRMVVVPHAHDDAKKDGKDGHKQPFNRSVGRVRSTILSCATYLGN